MNPEKEPAIWKEFGPQIMGFYSVQTVKQSP
jgi:hypothetical protein